MERLTELAGFAFEVSCSVQSTKFRAASTAPHTLLHVPVPCDPSLVLRRAAFRSVFGCGSQEEDLLHMERTVLNSLGFRINAPTAYTFWSIFRMSHAAADETSSLALYLTVRLSPRAARRPGPAAGPGSQSIP